MQKSKAIIKVGKSSTLKLHNMNMLRALTFDSAFELYHRNNDIDILIIESIPERDKVKAEKLIDEVKGNNTKVIIYNEILSEVEKDVSTNKEVEILHSNNIKEYIENTLNINVEYNFGTKSKGKNKTKDSITETNENDNVEIISSLDVIKASRELVENNIDEPKEVYLHPAIDSKDDIDFMIDGSDVEDIIEDAKKDSDNSISADIIQLLSDVTKDRDEIKKKQKEAEDRIELLLSLKSSLEIDLEHCRNELYEVQSKHSTLELSLPAKLENQRRSLAEEMNIKLKEKEEEIQSINDKLTKYKKEIEDLTVNRNSLNEQVEELTAEIISLKEELDIVKNRSEETKSEDEALKLKINELNIQVENYNKAVEDLKKEIEEKELENKNLEKELNDLTDSNSSNKNQIEAYKKEIDTLSLEKESLTEQLTDLNKQAEELNKQINKLEIEIKSDNTKDRLRCEIETNNILRNVVSNLILEPEELIGRIGKSKKENEKLKSLVININNKNDVLNKELDEEKKVLAELHEKKEADSRQYEEEVSNLKMSLYKSDSNLAAAKRKITELEKEIKRYNEELDKYSNQEEIIKMNEILTKSNNEFLTTIEGYKRTLVNLETELDKARSVITTLNDKNNNLQNTLASTARAIDGSGGKLKFNCDYQANGVIIPVFGSGSYGITTTAISIARRLPSSKVLYMDMDLVNPKGDEWLGKSPIIKELPDIKNSLNKSGLGSLIEKGVDYVVDHKDLIFQNIILNKKGSNIDYFSGIYTKVDYMKLVAIDFSGLMNYLGSCYDYIVVDLGRFGSSDIVNALIKMYDEIALKTVIVSLSQRYDTRTLSIKMNNEKINREHAIWILNIANSTTIDPIVKKSVGSIKTIIFPKDVTIYGENLPYDKVPILKDKLDELIENIVGM